MTQITERRIISLIIETTLFAAVGRRRIRMMKMIIRT